MSIITLNTRSLPDSAVTTAKVAADAITDAKIADDVVGTEHLTAGEVDATALGADSVTAAKINDDIISGATALTAEPADTDEFLVSDAGTLKRIDYSLIKGGGITEADQWRLSSNLTGHNDDITANLERVDDSSATYIGTGMSQSSGTFTFPSTGKWLVQLQTSNQITSGGTDNYVEVDIMVTTDNSSYVEIARATNGVDESHGASNNAFAQAIIDVTDTSNVKVRFHTGSHGSGTVLMGHTSRTVTGFFFIRLGDT